MVVTTQLVPAGVSMRMVLLEESATKRFPAPSAARPVGDAN